MNNKTHSKLIDGLTILRIAGAIKSKELTMFNIGVAIESNPLSIFRIALTHKSEGQTTFNFGVTYTSGVAAVLKNAAAPFPNAATQRNIAVT